jgi:hypothetical protein
MEVLVQVWYIASDHTNLVGSLNLGPISVYGPEFQPGSTFLTLVFSTFW